MSEPIVTITGMDKNSSTPSGEGALVNVHLNITPPPSGWISLFDQTWAQHIYMMKRRAHATTRHIIIRCMPNELNSDHLPELKKVIAETDEAYRKAVAVSEQRKQRQEEQDKKFRDDLDDAADNLNL